MNKLTSETLTPDTTILVSRTFIIYKPSERYIFLHQEVFKSFMVREVDHGDDSRISKEAILDIDSGKRLEAKNFEIEFMHLIKFGHLLILQKE